MKKNALPLLMVAAIVSMPFLSCNKIKSQISIPDIFANSKDILFDIPPSTAGFHSQSADVTFDLNAEISSGNSSGVSLSASNVKSATVSSVSVDITSGSNTANSFANFSDGGVALYSNVAPTQVSVAQVMNNPDVNSVHLEIPVTGTSDISSYLKGSVITYLYGYSLRRATTATLHAVMHVKYAITLGL